MAGVCPTCLKPILGRGESHLIASQLNRDPRKRRSRVRVEAFRCPTGKGWHVGQPKPIRHHPLTDRPFMPDA